ncbi:MAG: hypothetical protein IKU86_03430, partial [Thermoguttaceae bacterium]|nr:hypothetical protein [Thermoguttaceae bacterium]
MSKHLRRRFRSASLRGVALAALLSASLVGAVGCAGGSNPFCGNSKEKCEVEEGLKRAQEIDEDLKNESKAKVEEAGRSVGILRTDGSGNASVAESAPTKRKTFDDEPSSPQKMLETASASDVAPDALNDAQVSVPEEKSESGVDDALLPAPAVPSNPAPAPTPVEAAPSV